MCEWFYCKFHGPDCAFCTYERCPDYMNCMICIYRINCDIVKNVI
jgi:hypothetical protein